MRKRSLILGCILIFSLSGCVKGSIEDPATPGNEVTVTPAEATTTPAETTITPTEEVPDEDEEHMTFRITEIADDYFMAGPYFPSPDSYKIYATLEDKYCVGDYIEVYYKSVTEIEEHQYECTATNIAESSYQPDPDVALKPVIYLYPTETTKVHVELDYQGELTLTYPVYENGWDVTATPDGQLTDENGKYPYLFWEGKSDLVNDMSKGYCIAGADSREFLTKQLSLMGLNEVELKEFVAFWAPLMEKNAYNKICFQTTNYTDYAKLTILPAPDSLLRIYMVYQPLEEYIEMEAPIVEPFERNGFTAVEWGGCFIK